MATRISTLSVSREQIRQRADELAILNPNSIAHPLHWLRLAIAEATTGELAHRLSPQGRLDRLNVQIGFLQADNRLTRNPAKLAVLRAHEAELVSILREIGDGARALAA